MNKETKHIIVPELRFPEFKDAGEWEEKRIDEFAPLQRGFDLPVDNIIEGKYPVVFSNGILKHHNEYKVIAPGIVTGRSGTIGKVTFVKEDFWPHNTSLWVTDFKGNYPLFVFYYFLLIRLEKFGSGSGVPTLNRNDVHNHKISVPSSLPEQQKIASCLSSLDELIAAENQKLETLKTHKKGLMQQLFPAEGETVPKLRFKEFLDSGEWEEKRIDEFAPLQRGFDLPVDNIVKGKYPVVFSNGILKYHNEYKVKAPGIVTGRSGTIGKVTFVEEDFWPHNTSLWVTDFKDNYPLFVFYYFLFIGLEKFGSGSGVPTLNRNDVHNQKIPIPSSNMEQQKIASCLSSLDELIAAQNQKIEALKVHKKGLMQGLFPNINEINL